MHSNQNQRAYDVSAARPHGVFKCKCISETPLFSGESFYEHLPAYSAAAQNGFMEQQDDISE